MIKAVIVDFDDTLCMTETAAFTMTNEILVAMGRTPNTHEAHQKRWGKPVFEAIKEDSPGIDVAEFRTRFEKKLADWVTSKRLDNVPLANLEALDELIAEGREVFILTSRGHSEVEHLIAPDHDLAARIKMFYYRDNMQFHKPDPRAFTMLLSDHQLQPEECVYIGDSLSDAAAAMGAGLHFVACLEAGLRTRAEFAELAVERFIDHFTGLPLSVAAIEQEVK